MKKILLTITAFLVTLFAVAQSPNLLNYQGVARNSVGNVLPSQPIGLRLSILSGGPTGTPVYTETRNVTTNAFGLFNVQVGSPGAITSTGTIAGINWTAFGVGSGTKFLQVEIDPIGGTNYFNVGSTQLVSVPYALYAGGAAPVGPAGGDLTGTYPNPQILFPLVKTFSFNASPLIGMTNSSATGTTGAIQGTSASNDIKAVAIQGTISSTTPGDSSSALRGINNGNGSLGYGIWGSHAGSGRGVNGTSANGFGVNGNSTTSTGVNGSSTSGVGVAGTSTSNSAGSFSNTTAANIAPTLATNTNGAGDALQAINSGTGKAGTFTINNAANANFAVDANSNGTNATVNSTNTGTGTAGTFTVNNTSSTTDALRVVTNGIGASWAIRATSTGTNGAGLFISNNTTTSNNNLQSNTNGLGRAGLFNSTNAASTANAVDINVAGTGFALRAASSNATPKALLTAGGVQLTGIGEANNLILKSDAVGNANWASPASVGIVTGTGTLNFVPKWTPNGTNLGNSQIFDNGTQVGIATLAPQHLLSVGGNTADAQNVIVRGFGGGPASWKGGAAFGNTLSTVIMGESVGVAQIGGHNSNLTAWADLAINSGGGNVGVGGTLTPQHKLSVGPATADVQGVVVRGFGGGPANWKGGAAFGNTTATVIMGELSGVANIGGHNSNLSAWAPLVINAAPGNNVGIGTMAPAYALDVNHNGANGLHVRSLASFSVVDLDAANGDAALRYQSAGATRWNVRNAPGTNDYQIIRNNSLPANVTINNGTGFVGITQTAPAYQLDVLHAGGVAGALGIRSKSSSTFSVMDVDAANGDAAVRFMNNGAADWHIGNGIVNGFDILDQKVGAVRMFVANTSGNVGINTNAPLAKLQVANLLQANNTYTTSTGFTGTTGIALNDATTTTNDKFGIYSRVDGTPGNTIGIFAEPGTTGVANLGLFGRVSAAPTAGGTSYGVFAFDAINNGTTTWAAKVVGRLQYQDGTQGAGKLLISNAAGDASWSTAAAANIISGNGTLNFIPKWTPNGNTLGNSQVFDNGVNVGIGTNAPAQTLHVNRNQNIFAPNMGGQLMLENSGTPFAGNTVAIDFVPIGYAFSSNIAGARITAFDDGNFSSSMLFSTKAPGASGNALTERMRVTSGGNVGINQVNPTARLDVNGNVKITDGTQGAGKVLTSDAAGVASWQASVSQSVGISIRAFTTPLVVPTSTVTPITQWAFIDNEDGGSNYNSVTGEYTISKTGVYQVNSSVGWPPGNTAADTRLILLRNGVTTYETLENGSGAGKFSFNHLAYAQKFNAGDKISISISQNSGSNQSTIGFVVENSLSIQYLHN